MKFSQIITAPAIPASIASLISIADAHSDGILVKHVSGTVNYGSPNGANIPLIATDGPVVLPSTNAASVFVGGGGSLVVGLF